MEAAQVERAGINLKPSGRMSEGGRHRGRAGRSRQDGRQHRRRRSDLQLPRRRRVLRRETRHQEGGHRHRQEPGAGDDRPVGLRQVDLPALPEPHERHDSERARRRLHPARRQGHPRQEAGRGAAARARRHGVPEAESVSEVHLRERGLRAAHPWAGRRPRRARRNRAQLAATRRIVGRSEGPPAAARHVAVRRPAAAPVHRAHDRRQPRSHPDGRAVFGARSRSPPRASKT